MIIIRGSGWAGDLERLTRPSGEGKEKARWRGYQAESVIPVLGAVSEEGMACADHFGASANRE